MTLHSPVFLLNSRYSHFIATSPRFSRKGLHDRRNTFSRSYGVKLPSSLTRFNSIVLGYSPHPPESVYGTITALARYETFLGSMESATSGVNSSHSPLKVMCPGFSKDTFYRLTPTSNCRLAYPSPSSLINNAITVVQGY